MVQIDGGVIATCYRSVGTLKLRPKIWWAIANLQFSAQILYMSIQLSSLYSSHIALVNCYFLCT